MGPEPKIVHDIPLPGAFDHGQGRVTFALYAPGKQSVHLIGSFNDWNHQSDPLTNIEGGLWATEKHLPKGVYCYQFLIDQNLVICDPYAMASQFREDEKTSSVAVLETEYESFEWQHDGWQRPLFRDLIIYELQIGDFSPEGSFQGVINCLDYLKDLGINAIELMPVYQPLPSDYWGYAPMFFLAPRSNYGSANDLRRLIDEAHGRGIAIILDLVLSHTSREHPFNKLYPFKQSPWYGRSLGGEENLFGLPSLDYSKDATNSFVRDVQIYWLNQFHVDGFRYDYLPAVGHKGEKGLPYLMKVARDIRPEAYLIGEYLPERPDIVNTIGVTGVWHGRFLTAMKALLSQTLDGEYKWSDFDKAICVLDHNEQGYQSDGFMINYLETHDEQRIVKNLRDKGVAQDDLLKRLLLGTTILFTGPGECMLYHGQEWGEDEPLRKVQPNPVHWEKLDTDFGRSLHEHHKRLIRLRREYGCMRSEGFSLDMVDKDRKCIAYHRRQGGQMAVVAANFSSERQVIQVPFPNRGRWLEFFSKEKLELRDSDHPNLEFEGVSAKIFLQG